MLRTGGSRGIGLALVQDRDSVWKICEFSVVVIEVSCKSV